MNRHLLQRVRLPIIAALAGIAWQVHAENTNLYTGNEWRLLELKSVLAAAADITLKNYPDCDEATVDERSVRVYHPDGTGQAQDENFVKVLTEKGRRANRTLTTGFLLPYFTAEVAQLEVIKPDGTVVPVDVVANSKETIDDSQMAMNIYDPNSKLLRVNIPKLEVGDIVHSIIRVTTKRSIIPDAFAELMVFESPGYIRHMSYEVHAPDARPLKCIRLRDEIKGTVSYSKKSVGDTLVHSWEVRNVPRIFEEPGMPPFAQTLQRLLISTMPDWQTVSKWYWNLSKAHLAATTPELKKQVAELTAGCTNDLQKVTALFYYVSKNIRYMGLTPEKDRPGFEPHDVCLTFDKKYGVCRDKAGLLVAMMRTAGLNAFPVLINVGTKCDPEVPDAYFNHAIAAVELTKGQYTLMDPTDENTQDLLPDSDRNQSFLVCRPEGERIQVSPIRPPEENLMRVKTTGTLDAAGTLVATSELWFDGVNDNAYRNAFVKMKPDDLQRFFQLALKRSLPGAKLTSLKVMPEDMLDTSSSLHAEIGFTVDGMIAAGSGKAVVSLPWIGKNIGIANFILAGTGGLEKRKYPLQTDVTCGMQENIELKLAGEFTGAVSMPDCKPVNDQFLGYQEHVTFANQTLDASRNVKLKVVEFTPAQYLQLKKILEHLEYDARKSPVLAMSGSATAPAASAAAKASLPVGSSARILESRKEITVQDAHTAVMNVKYSKEILTYNGKKREAEVKIEFNPSCQEAKLIRAVVVSKDGQRKEISPEEMNVMDAGWNGSAKRYTGGKILVANLPGVEIGSTIEVEFEVKTTGKAFLAGYEMFQLPDALDKKQVQLTVPAAIDVQSYAGGASGIVQTESSVTNSSRVFQWSAQDVKALPAETQLPPEWVYSAGVGYFIGDASAYWKELNDTMLDRAGKNLKAAELARQLTASAKSKVEAIKAIRDYIATSIRTAGPSFTELPLAELSAADTTLADGYGHHADRAILIHAMLSAAGFHPEFVMASRLPPIAGITNVTASLPLPQNFDAPLVRVTVDGVTYYLNDTDQYAQLGSTAHDNRLAVIPATQASETVKAAKDCQNKSDTFYSMTLADNGKARIGIRRQYFGLEYNAKKKYFTELPPEEKNRYFQELISSVAQGAKPVGGLATKFDAYPGVEEFTVEIDHFCVVDGKNYYFDLPFALSIIGGGSDQRALPLYLPVNVDNNIRAEIKLPPGFQRLVITPADEHLELPAGAGGAVITSTNAKGQFTVIYQMDMTPAIISPADYPSVLNVESTLGKKSARVFLLEKGK